MMLIFRSNKWRDILHGRAFVSLPKLVVNVNF